MDSNLLFPQSCRICSLEHENGIYVFGDEGKKLYLEGKIKKYLQITVSVEDKLPKMICRSCCKRLEGFHKFATTAVKIQDKLKKLIASPTNFTSLLEPKEMNPNEVLHTYLTKGAKDMDDIVYQQDAEVTEMEVRVDPMLVLQYALDEDEYLFETEPETDSSQALQETCTKTEETELKPFFCLNCSERFASESALKTHVWCHYIKTKRVVLTNYDNLICEVVQKPVDKNPEKVTPPQTGRAKLTRNKSAIRFICPVCSKAISTKGNLKVHLETHRPKGKYACDICGRIFKTQCNLNRHKEYHEGVQYPCTVCGRVYPTNSTLRAHSITHSDLRPHKCPLCEKTFKRNQDLKFHINQHTGARPYKCPYCPKAFASSGNCFSHRKRMHPIEVERDKERVAKIMR